MAISYVDSTANASSTGSSLTVTRPSGVAAGDLILVFINTNGPKTITDDNGSAPFTKADDVAFNGPSAALYVFYRIAGASEPATYTFSASASDRWAILCGAYRGVNTSDPFDVAPSGSTENIGSGTTPTGLGFASLTNDAWAIAVMGVDSTGQDPSAFPSGYSLRENIATQRLTYSDKALGTAGLQSAVTWTIAGNGWGTYHFALKPATTATPPTVTTSAVSGISQTTAAGNGNVTSDGGAAITERGVCWNTTGTPTTADSTATSAGTTGAFTASMTGLSPSTTYYVRAYATNSEGTSYGSAVSFTTMPDVSMGITAHGSGNLTSTQITVALPSYAAEDYFILFISRNQPGTFTFGSNVTATALADASGRLAAYRIAPNTLSETSFTVSAANAVWTWALVSITGVDDAAAVESAVSAIGNSTTAAVAFPVATLGYIATGNEVAFAVAGVNATATWTTDSSTVFGTTSGNAALLVRAAGIGAGDLTAAFSDADRGLEGTTRNETSLVFVLQASPNGTDNLLTNASFETGTTAATGWETEGDVAGTVTYSLSATGVADGAMAQRVQYAGVTGDDGSQYFAIYQAPITGVAPGDTLEFSIAVSGSLTNAYLIAGIEGFLSGGAYISEESVQITELSSTPTTYTVQYTCPANTDYVAVFIQSPSNYATTAVDAYLDRATLVVAPTTIYNLSLIEAVSLTDTLRRSASRVFAEVVTLIDAVTRQASHSLAELTALSDALRRKTSRTFAEVAALADAVRRTASRAVSATAAVADTVATSIIFTLGLADAATLADALTRTTSKALTEAVSLTDAVVRTVTMALTEAVPLADSVASSLARRLSETATATAMLARRVGRALAETLAPADALATVRTYVRTLADAIPLADTFRRALSKFTVLTEAAGLADVLGTELRSQMRKFRTVLRTLKNRFVLRTRDDKSTLRSKDQDRTVL